MKRFFILCFLLSCSLTGYSQEFLQKGNECFTQGDYDCAKKNYEAHKIFSGQDLSDLIDKADKCKKTLAVANFMYESKELDEAAEQYKKVLELNPSDPRAKERISELSKSKTTADSDFLKKANECFTQGDYDCAKKNYEAHKIFSGQDISDLVNKADKCKKTLAVADFMYESKALDEAAEQYKKVLELNPDDPLAKERISELSKSKPTADSDFLKKANECFTQGDYDCAKKNYEAHKIFSGQDVTELVDKADKCKRTLAVADFMYESKELDEAAEQYKKVLELNPDDPWAKERISELSKSKITVDSDFLKKANECFTQGDYDCAKKNYETHTIFSGEDISGLLDKTDKCQKTMAVANFLYESNVLDDAIAQYKKVLEMNPDDPHAKKQLNSLEKVEPSSITNTEQDEHLHNAIACFDKGDYDCARKNYELYQTSASIDVSTQLSKIEQCQKLLSVADFLYESEELDDAKDQYKKLLEINPKDPHAKERYDNCNKQNPVDTGTTNENPDSSLSDAYIIQYVHNNLVKVEGGTFTMGCNMDFDNCYPNEQPAHQVTINGFKISKTETTNNEYAAFLNALNIDSSGRYKNNRLIDISAPFIQIEYTDNKWAVKEGFENHPITNVSWYGATEYCIWVGGRLPTEAEWEYAARGGNNSKGYKYAGSNTLSEVAWYTNNSKDNISGFWESQPVGKKQSNELGLYDMSGNVYEWCSDWYIEGGGYSKSPKNNPTGPATGKHKVIRGGSFCTDERHCRSIFRTVCAPENSLSHNGSLGFRVLVPYD
ncbi:MAG: SUMF1/EgtB/PvdO family nonheme iron enzyme [Prevotellaceae bacterium]|jgi:formylglycine-generating enzyme required for sulfatase activity/outer membrane protein assembly factor BamD (BamD/ComL family)|nr:SUMF1/EgtB/PvdO family nonheme iron enzyme [Prevotellaceae bacterium]